MIRKKNRTLEMYKTAGAKMRLFKELGTKLMVDLSPLLSAKDNDKLHKIMNDVSGICSHAEDNTTIDTNGILQTRYYANTDIDNLVSAVEILGKDKNVYFNIFPRKSDISENERGTADDVTYLSCIGSDFDVKSPAHTEQNLPPDKESISELISSVLPTPTFTVDTGHGIDAFWVFETPYKIGDNISLEKALCQVGESISRIYLISVVGKLIMYTIYHECSEPPEA